jgi:hypothetical protein
MNRREERASEPQVAAFDERRGHNRRRGDAHSVAETLANVPEETIARTFTLGGSSERHSVLYNCGCVAVDPDVRAVRVQLLECPTHAALSGKLRRRQTDRY